MLVNKIPESERKDFVRALVPDMMSSEDDLTDDEGRKYYLVKPLKWRTKKFQKIVEACDGHYKETCSDKSKEQTRPRKIGEQSIRKPPEKLDFGYELFIDKHA